MRPLPPHPRLYEVNTRVWIKRFNFSTQQAALRDIPAEFWRSLSDKGIHLVWLMGVWRVNMDTIRKYAFTEELIRDYREALPDWTPDDVIGSPYAVEDYVLDPALGAADDLQELRLILNSHGIRLILDFVPNHFGADSYLIRENPAVFLAGSEADLRRDPETFYRPEGSDRVFAHGRDPYFPPWKDTVQVNYFQPEAREFMAGKLLRLAELCDGVRCDMAMLMLNDVFLSTWRAALGNTGEIPREEFWPGAIQAVKSRFPGFLFIAEAYWGREWSLLEMGFDFVYDKALLDLMRDGDPGRIRGHLTALADRQPRCVHFLENHDEARAMAALGQDRSRAAAVLISTIPGLCLYHDGQFEGKRVRLPVQLGREPAEPPNEEIRAFYDRLLNVTRSAIFLRGQWRPIVTSPATGDDSTWQNLLAWSWHLEARWCLVVINFSDAVSRGFLRLDLLADAGRTGLRDLFGPDRDTGFRVSGTGLSIVLDRYQFRILTPAR